MSLLEKEKSPDKTDREKEAKKKMALNLDKTAKVPDNSFVKTNNAEVVYDTAKPTNNTAE